MNNYSKRTRTFNSLLIFFIFLFFSFLLLFFCTASSPRYATNPWVDSNAFFTVGKAMANGIIPYKDIFEQKGPLLYFIHTLAYFLSKTSFFGVYFFESLSFAVTGLFTYKIASLYLSKPGSVMVSCIALAFICNSYCFYYGDSAEEFSLPLMAISFYYILSYFKDSDKYKLNWIHFFVNGILAGCIALIKFTLIGFWFAWMALLALHMLFTKKIKEAFAFSFIFLAGMITAFIPWIIYFWANGAIKDFIDVYFIINSTAYANQNSFITRCLDIIFYYRKQFSYYPITLTLTLIGAVIPLFFKFFSNGKFYSRLTVPFSYACSVFFILFGGRSFTYYFLPLTFFVLFGFIAIGYYIERLTQFNSKPIIYIPVVAAVLSVLVVSSSFLNINSKFTIRHGEETYQSQISDYISQHNPDGKILSYNMLDLGIYLPNNYTDLFKHFELQNISPDKYPENLDSQNYYITSHQAYYVVTKVVSDSPVEKIYESNPALLSDYNLVMKINTAEIKQKDVTRVSDYTIYLFELKEGYTNE